MIVKKAKEYIYTTEPSNSQMITCIECGGYATETHHPVGQKAYRKKTDKLKLTVRMCNRCHWRLHNEGGCNLKKKYQKIQQKIYEKYLGTRKEWMALFHNNFLWDEE